MTIQLHAAAKKNPLLDGVADLRDPVIRTFVLDRFPARDVWGVGRAIATKLAEQASPRPGSADEAGARARDRRA